MKRPLFSQIASTLEAFNNCMAATPRNDEWAARHTSTVDDLTEQFMPSGSGIDSGCTFDWDESKPNRMVFNTSYHHMNDHGYYDGWTEHKIIVTPSLTSQFDLKITGRDRNEIKEYLADVFQSALSDEIDHDANGFFSPDLRARQAEFKAKVASGEIT